MDKEQTINELAKHIEAIITLLGEDPAREGLLKTPIRSAKALYYLTEGYRHDATEVVKQAVFSHDGGSKIIIVKDVEFYSMCEHHILPFFGKISIGYIPTDKIVGLSKLARLVNVYARRLQVQERLTAQIANALEEAIPTRGVIVTCTAQHLCMKMRGVEKQDSSTTTMHCTGLFNTDPTLRQEFFQLL